MKRWNNVNIKVKDEQGNWVPIPGIAGESAYEIAVRNGTFTGTEQEWLNALETERAAAVASIQSSGAATVASIPNDYTTLSNEVSQLSEEIDATNNVAASIISLAWEKGGIDNGTGQTNNDGSSSRSRVVKYYQDSHLVSVANNCTGSNERLWILYYRKKADDTYVFSEAKYVAHEDTYDFSDTGRYVRFDLRSGIANTGNIVLTGYSNIVFNSIRTEGALSTNNHVDFEIGSITAGSPVTSAIYVRTHDFIKASKHDTLTIKPTSFSLKGGAIYLYDAPSTASYSTNVDIPLTSANGVYTYAFGADCYFKIRCAKNDYDTIVAADVESFESAITFNHHYSYLDFEKSNPVSALNLDYDTLKGYMTGKVNFAVQTDTHMSAFKNYDASGTAYNASDFASFYSVLKSIDSLGFDGFFNLGDIVRGYEFDFDYETRASLDKIIKGYSDYISTKKCFAVGNHDDGNLFYYNSTYNDKKSAENVIYPNEQFNRIVKFGDNSNRTKNYFYTDINGIRVIVLYQRDTDYATSVPQIESFAIGNAQLQWLTETALDTNLPVLVLTHAPLLQSLFATSGAGFDDAVAALTDFVDGGGKVIAVLSGHTHAQNYATSDGINHIVLKNGYTFFEMINIDLVNRTITCKAVNNNNLQDISLSY